jgi:PIN domain nuclease of toxin-antitoxin system
VKALLDTHAILFMASDPARLGTRARSLVEDPANILYASLASLWEIVIKAGIGKLELQVPIAIFWTETLERARLIELSIEKNAVIRTMDMDLSHRDPFDRLLAAQALVAGIVFISQDTAVDAWGVERIW